MPCHGEKSHCRWRKRWSGKRGKGGTRGILYNCVLRKKLDVESAGCPVIEGSRTWSVGEGEGGVSGTSKAVRRSQERREKGEEEPAEIGPMKIVKGEE